MIAVETITFNHDTSAATHDALNIRRNATETVDLPEWRRFISVNPETRRRPIHRTDQRRRDHHSCFVELHRS